MAVLKGISSGAFNNAQVVWVIEIWKEKSGPFLQALQFFISIGSFITPLMNKPFLIDCLVDSANNNFEPSNLSGNYVQKFSNISLNESFDNSNSTFDQNSLLLSDRNFTIFDTSGNSIQQINANLNKNSTQDCSMTSLIPIPYAVTGILSTCGSMFLIVLFLFLKQKQKKEKSIKQVKTLFNDEKNKSSKICWSRKFYILTGFVMLGSFFGLEIANFQILATFTRYINKEISGKSS